MVIKKEVLNLASTTLRMLKVDVNDKKNHHASDRIALGTAISNLLKGVSISLEKKSKFKNNVLLWKKRNVY